MGVYVRVLCVSEREVQARKKSDHTFMWNVLGPGSLEGVQKGWLLAVPTGTPCP